MRAVKSISSFVITVIAAAAVGFGVPVLWLWIGSILQGDQGATSVNFSVAMAVLFGIIFTYVLMLYLAGLVMSMFTAGADESHAPRSPWMRGMTDTRAHQRQQDIGGIERVFVVTTMIVTAAFWLWFAFESGSPLPNQ